MQTFEDLYSFVQKCCTNGQATADHETTPKSIKIPAKDLLSVCEALHQDQMTYFDMLSCVTGVDNGPEVAIMEVVYNLYSIPYDHHLMIKVILPRENPEIDSVSRIWKTADWHEREIFDMYGIKFNDHPDLRRILMPADWEGHPLKKDYRQQAYYRDIKLDY